MTLLPSTLSGRIDQATTRALDGAALEILSTHVSASHSGALSRLPRQAPGCYFPPLRTVLMLNVGRLDFSVLT